MKKIVYILVLAVISLNFTACNNDETMTVNDHENEVPEYSLQNSLDLIGTNLADFQTDYPQAIKSNNNSGNGAIYRMNCNLEVASKLQNSNTIFNFKNNILEGIQFNKFNNNNTEDFCLYYSDEISKFIDKKADISVSYNENGATIEKTFDNYLDFKSWIANINKTDIDILEYDITWIYSKTEGKETLNIPVKVRFEKCFSKTDNNNSQIFYSIGESL